MNYAFLAETVADHLHSLINGDSIELESCERQPLVDGLRELVTDAYVRSRYAVAIRKALEDKDLQEEAEALLKSPELHWENAVETALNESTDQELVIFLASPLAIMVLTAHLLENESYEVAMSWMEPPLQQYRLSTRSPDADKERTKQAVKRIIEGLEP